MGNRLHCLTQSVAQALRGEQEGEADVLMVDARVVIQHYAILRRPILLASD